MADQDGVHRVRSISDLPDQTLLHTIAGHEWGDPPVTPIESGWGNAKVSRAAFTCSCGRRRTEVIADNSGELLSRVYGGGYLLATGVRVTRADARAEWLHRKHLKAQRTRRTS
jgi:hypothetical protein